MELNSEEQALVEAYRKQRIDEEAARAVAARQTAQPFPFDAIKVGMSAADTERAHAAILAALKENR